MEPSPLSSQGFRLVTLMVTVICFVGVGFANGWCSVVSIDWDDGCFFCNSGGPLCQVGGADDGPLPCANRTDVHFTLCWWRSVNVLSRTVSMTQSGKRSAV